MKINKKLIIVISVLAIIITSIIFYKNRYIKNKYIDIDNLVYEAYTYKNGYDDNMKKHMDIKVFNSSNLYRRYNEKKSENPPTDISLSFKEINQHKIYGKIFVYMKYTLEMNTKYGSDIVHTGAWDNIVVFQLVEKNGEPYIEKRKEYEIEDDIPKAYR